MIAGLAGIAMSCVGCTGIADAAPVVVQINPRSASVDASFEEARAGDVPFTAGDIGGTDFRLPLKVGNAFSPTNWSQPEAAARFEALDLSTPISLRRERGDVWSAEMAFSASGEQTGLGFDVQLAPRARFQHGRAGMDVANFGGELRLGQGLAKRDQRHTDAKQPAWYFFIGQDNEALVWNFADKQSLDGLALRDQVTVGDFQAGMAWRTGHGSQTSFGLVQRKLGYNDPTGDHDVSLHQDFAAFSFTLKR
jgi:hypothetical protein